LFVFASEQLNRPPCQLCLEDIKASLALNFLTHIEQQRGNGATTRNSRLAAIKAFMHYVEFRVPSALEQIMQIRAIPTKRHDQALVRHLAISEVRAILDAPDLTTRLGIRDRAMLHLCFACGLRVSELVGLRIMPERRLRKSAEQLDPLQRWYRILSEALRHFISCMGGNCSRRFASIRRRPEPQVVCRHVIGMRIRGNYRI
jgi:site-specific recombinase XerC